MRFVCNLSSFTARGGSLQRCSLRVLSALQRINSCSMPACLLLFSSKHQTNVSLRKGLIKIYHINVSINTCTSTPFGRNDRNMQDGGIPLAVTESWNGKQSREDQCRLCTQWRHHLIMVKVGRQVRVILYLYLLYVDRCVNRKGMVWPQGLTSS